MERVWLLGRICAVVSINQMYGAKPIMPFLGHYVCELLTSFVLREEFNLSWKVEYQISAF